MNKNEKNEGIQNLAFECPIFTIYGTFTFWVQNCLSALIASECQTASAQMSAAKFECRRAATYTLMILTLNLVELKSVEIKFIEILVTVEMTSGSTIWHGDYLVSPNHQTAGKRRSDGDNCHQSKIIPNSSLICEDSLSMTLNSNVLHWILVWMHSVEDL